MKTGPNQNTKAQTDRDPVTGRPGTHPLGTGVGAASGGAAGAALGAAAGPVGAAAGAIVGAVAGGIAGKGVAEMIGPTVEEAFWRENHERQAYAKGRGYDHFASAYRAGISGYAEGRTFEEQEDHLRAEYESKNRRPGNRSLEEEAIAQMEWQEAREASRAAYDRLAKRKVGGAAS